MSFPSLDDLITYLHGTLFRTVSGLVDYDDDGEPVNLLDYEPDVVHAPHLLYTLLADFKRDTAGQVTTMRYRLLHRLVIQWQDNQEAERVLRSFVHPIPAAFDADPLLGNLITKGLARISDGASGFVVISNTKFRCLDFFSDIPTKATYRSGI